MVYVGNAEWCRYTTCRFGQNWDTDTLNHKLNIQIKQLHMLRIKQKLYISAGRSPHYLCIPATEPWFMLFLRLEGVCSCPSPLRPNSKPASSTKFSVPHLTSVRSSQGSLSAFRNRGKALCISGSDLSGSMLTRGFSTTLLCKLEVYIHQKTERMRRRIWTKVI